MNPHVETLLQASGTTRSVVWLKPSEVKNPDHAASEAAYRKAKERFAYDDDNRVIDPAFPGITRRTMREACEAIRPQKGLTT